MRYEDFVTDRALFERAVGFSSLNFRKILPSINFFVHGSVTYFLTPNVLFIHFFTQTSVSEKLIILMIIETTSIIKCPVSSS